MLVFGLRMEELTSVTDSIYYLQSGRIGADEDLDDGGKSKEEVQKEIEEKELQIGNHYWLKVWMKKLKFRTHLSESA